MAKHTHPTAQKLRGGYYTPEFLTDYVSQWVLQNQPAHTAEPSCGDGAFVKSFLKYHAAGQLSAHELLDEEADKVETLLSDDKHQVYRGDFLACAIPRLEKGEPCYDAVLGNPPFIRYQLLTDDFQIKIQKVFALLELPFTKHTNAWVPFVLACIALLKPGGRLGMVIPAEIIHVLHASPLRQYLLESCERVMIIDPKELWFENTQQGCVILFAIKKQSTTSVGKGISIFHAQDNGFITTPPDALFKHAPAIPFKRHDKWTSALLSSTQLGLLNELTEHQHVHKMGDISRIEVGIVTGANEFFLVDEDTVDKYELHAYIRPMFGKSEHCKGVIFDDEQHVDNAQAGKPAYLVYLDKPFECYPERVQQYILLGESKAFHARYKCRIRAPWYQVPSMHTTNVAMWKRTHHAPRLIHNSLGAHTTDTAYRVTINSGHSPQQMVHAFSNPLTALSAELSGRFYGGGVLEITPSEAKNLLIPLSPIATPHLDELNRDVQALDTQTLMNTHGATVLRAIGLTEKEVAALVDGWKVLKARRQRTD